MTQYISREHARKCVWLAIVFLYVGLPSCAQVSNAPSAGDQKNWEALEETARGNLREASECAARETRGAECNQQGFLDAAASDYREMARMLISMNQSPSKVGAVANGLLRSGHAAEAIGFLRRHEYRADGNLLHLMADALFFIGDYKNAGVAYKNWIDAGCTGYLFSLDDTGMWAMRKNADRCASLPLEVSARLEHLREIAGGEPANLPKQEQPAIRATSR